MRESAAEGLLSMFVGKVADLVFSSNGADVVVNDVPLVWAEVGNCCTVTAPGGRVDFVTAASNCLREASFF
jgi:hypothetical protein